jgi:hypothetical protein
MATSWVSGSDLIVSTCEIVLDSSPGVDSGVTECGMFAVMWSVSVLFDIELMMLDALMLGNATRKLLARLRFRVNGQRRSSTLVLLGQSQHGRSFPFSSGVITTTSRANSTLTHLTLLEGMSIRTSVLQDGGGEAVVWRGMDFG